MSDDDQRAPNGGGATEKAADPQPGQPDGTSSEPDFSVDPAEGFDTLSEYMAAVERLAALPEHEYDRVRIEEAGLLRVRRSTLDKAVKQARPKDADEGRAGHKIELPTVEPWPDPVDGEALLSALVAQLKRFLVAPDSALDAVALWILHTHAFEAWWISPKLLVKSATKRCGKTRVFEVVERVVARRLLISLSTCSSVFRVIEMQGEQPPTLLMDEADRLTQSDDNMRKLINAGQSKSSANVLVSVPTGDGGWESRQFSTWAPIALAGIGDQADTIQDRAVTVRMKRKPKARVVEKLRGNRDYGFHELARKCARWAADHVEALKEAEPAMPEMLQDRAQDNWEPLVAIADAVGGEWPARARKAALLLQQASEQMDEDEVAVQLLHDIDSVFESEGVDRTLTATLLDRLHDMEDRLWSTYGRSETRITGYQLSGLLRQFDVHSRQMKIEVDGEVINRRGYERAQFVHVLAQYPKIGATPLPSAETLVDSHQPALSKTDPRLMRTSADSAQGSGVAAISGGSAGTRTFSGSEWRCEWCGGTLPFLSRKGTRYCSDACRQASYASTEGGSRKKAERQRRQDGGTSPPGSTPTLAAVAGGRAPTLTRAKRDRLLERGVHELVIAELRPEDARRMLDAPETVYGNARRPPEQDLRELAAAVARYDSRDLASTASRYANAVVITPATIDSIKAGNMVQFAVRDAVWTALA